MKRILEKIKSNENGAITVDWTVLAAMLVGLSIAVLTAVEDETTNLTSDIMATIDAQDVTGSPTSAQSGTPGG